MPKKKIYTVATSHLDTVWSWDFETTVSQYIYNTLVDNFKLFEKYPSYKFSFVILSPLFYIIFCHNLIY